MESRLGRSALAVAVGCAFAALAATSVALASTSRSAGTATLAPLVVSVVPASTAAEPHPEIRAAIRSLERARDHLQHAAHDFGGHRVEAIAAIDAALKQLRLALDFDKD